MASGGMGGGCADGRGGCADMPVRTVRAAATGAEPERSWLKAAAAQFQPSCRYAVMRVGRSCSPHCLGTLHGLIARADADLDVRLSALSLQWNSVCSHVWGPQNPSAKQYIRRLGWGLGFLHTGTLASDSQRLCATAYWYRHCCLVSHMLYVPASSFALSRAAPPRSAECPLAGPG